MKTTKIDEVRDIAIAFAHLPIEPNEKFPIFVSHPFINSAMTVIPSESGQEMINVLEGDGEKRFRTALVNQLKRTDKLIDFFLMLNNAYRFTFLDHIRRYLSDDDLGMCLRYIWTCSEFTNSSTVFTKKQLVSLFSRSSKNTLMDEDELPVFQELPERITVYRGTNSMNSEDVKVLSWTLSRKKAEWFASRFDDDTQYVFQAELPKNGALAYFSYEEEIVANPYMLENIQKIS